MKRIIFMLIIFVSIFIIYIFNQDKKIYYLSVGDDILINDDYPKLIHEVLGKKEEKLVTFHNKGMRSIDLISMIKDNKKNSENITMQNAFIKADIVVISVGNNDLMSKFSLYNLYNAEEIYDYIDKYLEDLDNLISLVRKNCKEKILFMGYYNIINDSELDKYYGYLINKTKKIVKRYNVEYIDLDQFNTKYRSNNLYPNVDGYKYLVSLISKYL